MSYLVLARKWRPRSFAELVGQEHVTRPLINALDHDRVHHAFLFTGTRGVGKTTIARIFAKSLNCEQGVSSTPCGVCSACSEVDQGRFIDLIEVDAASRTKVEDTRDLLDNVQYAPTRGRYKVYLIDEVHMLSNHSFNALLKTLEEPPPHIKFLLATTDPQRLPITILSRCLQFNLKRLSTRLIAAHLSTILEQEQIQCEHSALNLIAQAGDGSMRDALSLLDQAIAFGNGEINSRDVSAMLGQVDQQQLIQLLQALTSQDAATVLTAVAELDQTATDYGAVLAELITWLQHIALAQAVPGASRDDVTVEHTVIQALAAQLSPEDVQLFYQIALIGRRDLPLSPNPRAGFEMVLLRMLCFSPTQQVTPTSTPAPVTQQQNTKPVHKPATSTNQPLAQPAIKPEPRPESPPTAVTIDTASTTKSVATHPVPQATDSPIDWTHLVEQLGLSAMAKQLALNCELKRFQNDELELMLSEQHAHMRNDNYETRLRDALQSHFGKPLQLTLVVGEQTAATPAQQHAEQQEARRQAAIELIQQDPNVHAMQETFAAEVKIDSVTATDDH